MLKVKNLRCGYGLLEVVKGVSFHVNTNEIVALLGANGAGKTTLMKALVGLVPAWGGDIRVLGQSTVGQPTWRSVFNGVALVPEGRMVFADMTVLENLVVGGYRNPDRDNAIALMLERFPRLRERSHQAAGTLSGGEQQMLAIARALVSRPRLLLLDEPSMGLAPLVVKELFGTIRELRHNDLTVLLIEQNAMAALSVADRAYVLDTGEITLEGPAADLLQNPEVRRAYLGKGK